MISGRQHGKSVIMGTFMGMQVIQSASALTTRPRFPDKKRTKRRMRRVRGKYGSWMVQVPGAFRFGGKLIVHPKIYKNMLIEARKT